MSSRTTRLLARSLVAAALFATGAAQANLVTNGGFETGDLSGWTTALDPLYDGVGDSSVLAVQAGNYTAYFGGAGSAISQTLATVAGSSYKLSFWLAAEEDVLGAAAPNAFSVDVGAGALLSLMDASASGYALYEAIFIAQGASTVLTFNFTQGPAFWDLDSVSVTLPEPGSLALLAAAGVGGLAASRRRKETSAPA